MAGVTLEIDPTSEDSANVPLVLVDNTAYFLLGEEWPAPDVDLSTVSSITTEGELPVTARHHNTTGTFQLRVVGSTAADLQTKLNYVDKKLAKIMREGGTLKRTTPSGSTYVTDLLSGSQAVQFTRRYTASNKCDVTITLTRRPYWRLPAVTRGSHTEATLPVLVFTEASITGDVSGAGTPLTITEGQGIDQWWLIWGLRSRYYTASVDAKLFYEAEGRTALGGSATAVGATGASGAGSNVMRSAALTTSYVAILSTQASGAGNHFAHIGDYQVYTRFQTPTANTGAVSVALEWSQGDFLKVTRNAAVSFPVDQWDGTWRFLNLGQVSLTKVVSGTQRWEGRIIAKSTVVGDTIDIDYLMLVPITEGSGVVSAQIPRTSPTTFTARDEFNQIAGLLKGKTAPIGGIWAGAGAVDANDFSVEATGHTAQRATAADAGNLIGRYALSGAAAMTATAVSVDVKVNARDANTNIEMGVLARYFDINNWVKAILYLVGSDVSPRNELHIEKRVAGSYQAVNGSPVILSPVTAATFYTVQLMIAASGAWVAWLNGRALAQGFDADMATGGALASGSVGMYDVNIGTSSPTRTYDNFAAWAPPADAALFASRQLQIRSDQVLRQDSAGVVLAAPSKYEGDYLLVPPSGREGRSVEIIVKACRNDPATGPDPTFGTITGQLIYTPRVVTLPE